MSNEASTTVISVADRSVKAISAAVAGLSKVVGDINSLSTVAETLSADIQQKEGQLYDLNRQLDLNTRTAKAELAVRVAEDENGVLSNLLVKNGLARVTNSELAGLRTELDTTRANAAAATEAAVNAASQQLHARYGAQLKSLEAEHKVANAELVAELRAVNERNNFLVDELAKARQDLVAERDARIKIAQAEAGRQGVVVNAGKQ